MSDRITCRLQGAFSRLRADFQTLEDLHSEAEEEIRRLRQEVKIREEEVAALRQGRSLLYQTVDRQNRLLAILDHQAEAKGWDVEYDWEVGHG
jgi:hypothetical protein